MLSRKRKEFDKYWYYERAVQSPATDVEYLRGTYKEIRGKSAVSLREDFCGTFAISCEWVKLNSRHIAHGVDLDLEPIGYGTTHYASKLKASQQNRLHIHNTTVMNRNLPKVDIIAAMNFSYFIFKKRAELHTYFTNCLRTLKRDGLFILDCFGGSAAQEANEERKDHRNFSYYWDQQSFNPITYEALFKIHFRVKGGPKIKDVFTYDWRMWTLPELRDLLYDVGFRKVLIHWEGTNRNGEGNGVFTASEEGEECAGWIAYLVAQK